MNNSPRQLEIMRNNFYDKIYRRYPQLRKRLQPLFRKATIIENNSEPILYSPSDSLNEKLIEPKLNNRKQLRMKMNTFGNKLKKQRTKLTLNKKVSEIKPKILWALK